MKPPRSEEEARDEIPCQGFGDEIPNVTQSKKRARIGAKPKAAITIPLYFLSVIYIERVACCAQ